MEEKDTKTQKERNVDSWRRKNKEKGEEIFEIAFREKERKKKCKKEMWF